jgi:hypothetical protein
MTHPRTTTSRRDVVSASEIASFVYCPEQWRLQFALGNRPENAKPLAQGESFHRGTARFDVWSRTLARLGTLLLLLSLLAAVVAIRLGGWRR